MEYKENDCGFNLFLTQKENLGDNADVWVAKCYVILLCRKIAFSHPTEVFKHGYSLNKVNPNPTELRYLSRNLGTKSSRSLHHLFDLLENSSAINLLSLTELV